MVIEITKPNQTLQATAANARLYHYDPMKINHPRKSKRLLWPCRLSSACWQRKMNKTTSAWSYKTTVLSPDGNFTADFDEAMEVGQGAPTRGILTIEEKNKKEVISLSSGASLAWSDDSRFLAFSEWTKNMNQVLCIYDTEERLIDRAPKEYRVIELSDFKDGIIHGIDSPIHRSKEIKYEYIK